ncbi:aminoacyl-tRNA hydrolase [Galactobacter sp.]|uniref:aminoacyl-tRNA hydrolase n=1 Tax=Galactobacter sp. TaxID=2676125 RepID=UPI0025B8DFED|nr:aminoacyl-tRNA hydrolase [Galactobacter sp.]
MTQHVWLVVGLGNPGANHAGQRHNVGQMALDVLADRMGGHFTVASRHRAQILEGRLMMGGPKVVLAKPTTYMNVSGGPVSSLSKYFNVEPDHVIVIHDEVDLDFDQVATRTGGSENGHNGLRDITKALGTRDYQRVRVGVGRPPGHQATADFVLSKFNSSQNKVLPFVLDAAADKVESLIG